ncbi:MAG: methyltransferase domain-containing protein [Proteobacteria bacterium]|nr:methyltransferase domain-containing protein [Pseudomonadota bacterium]
MSSNEYFAQVAGDWDRLRAGFFSTAVRDTALRLAGLTHGGNSSPPSGPIFCQATGQTAADLGAGTGFVTEALLEAGLSVACVDQSPDMLAELAAKFGASDRVTTFEGRAEDLPLPDASVDFVFANMFLHHVDDPARAIAEMARIVRPGGRVVITDLDRHSHDFLLTEHHDRWPGFAREDVKAWLDAAGLAGGQVDCANQDCCADSCDGQDTARVSIFAAHAARPLCARRASQVDPLAVGRLARSFWEAERPLLCAEAVLLGVSQGLGCASPLIPRLTTGFCSGLSRSCGPCGAFSAGVMALGLVLGRDSGHDDLDDTYGPALEHREYFLERFGSLNCRELTGHDLGSPEGLKAYRQQGLKAAFCGPLLEAAAAQVVCILAEHEIPPQAGPEVG